MVSPLGALRLHLLLQEAAGHLRRFPGEHLASLLPKLVLVEKPPACKTHSAQQNPCWNSSALRCAAWIVVIGIVAFSLNLRGRSAKHNAPMGTCPDVDRMMLASNGYIPGQTINVNGGWYMS
jgi:hypothetical protein